MKIRLSVGLVAGIAALLAGVPAQARVYDFSFSGPAITLSDTISGMGTFITTGASSPYDVTGIAGTMNDPDLAPNAFTITGPAAYAGDDQLLYTPANSVVDFPGISYAVNNAGGAWNIFSFGPGSYGLLSSLQNPAGDPGAALDGGSDSWYPIMLTLSAVPETPTWAMLGLGFAGLGVAAAGRRRRTAIAAFG